MFSLSANSQEVKKVGKFKDWEAMVIVEQTGKVCFAQSVPVLQAPKSNLREARMFVSFRPGEKISNEISITGGYEFNNKNSITAKSGKSKYKFDIAQEGFAWIANNKIENKMIKTMKRGSRIMITGYNQKGSQTIDHYSLLGFTKAYNAAKTSCS
ncbi:invasion associated locus B family protein [Candidatus Pelagibacter sp.]|nr:invasion associated locus B family protein [Candidatus Pelagibacter sp.]